jgi:hypothetical protein
MQYTNSTDRALKWGLVAVTAAIAVGMRLALVPNIFAVGALGLYAGRRLPLWFAWVPSMAVMAITDLILEKWYAYPPCDPWVYVSFLVYVVLGRLLIRTSAPWRIGSAAVLGSLQFFLISNFGTWYTSHGLAIPMYPRTLAGLIECYTMGLPFLKYTLIGDLGFTTAVFGAEAWLTQPASKPAAEEARA